MKIDDEYKEIILMCSLPGSYDHLVITFTYNKDIINLNIITATFLSHSQRKQNVDKGTQGDSLYVKWDQDHGRNKG